MSSILEVQAIAPNTSRSWFLEGDQIIAGMLTTQLRVQFILITSC